MTDKERMDWLVKHCYYLEHDKVDKDGFWPHEDDEPGIKHFNEDYVGLTLRDYIDTRIMEERAAFDELHDRQAADRIEQLIESRLYREIE